MVVAIVVAAALLAVPSVDVAARPLVGTATSTHSATPAALAAPALPALWWPVRGPVVTAWVAPDGPYGPGHRGVDIAVAQGATVHAMGDGVVAFSGFVAGVAWISIDHVGGVRTTVGPMATSVVTVGARVTAGSVVGTSTATAHATAGTRVPGLLHVSTRIDGVYVDPASLVARLVPTLVAAAVP